MSQHERTGKRTLEYSGWHRFKSIKRYLDERRAWNLHMIDVDAVEYDSRTKQPLALIETARDVGQPHKTATVMKHLAERAMLPAYVVLYKVSDDSNDIEGFRVKRIHPQNGNDGWRHMTPKEYAEFLAGMRR